MKTLLYRLKLLPWRSLFQAAILTTLIVLLLEFSLLLLAQLPTAMSLLSMLFSPPLGLLVAFAIAVGVGALAVGCLERLNRPAITTGSLWALVLCLAIVLLLRGFLPLPGVIQLDQLQFIGLVVGIFWKGRPYWTVYRRW